MEKSQVLKGRSRKKDVMKYTLILIAVIVFIIFAFLKPETFPTYSNIMTFFRQGSIYGIVVIGVTWVLAMDEMDVSFPEIAAFASVLCATLVANGMNLDVAAIITLVCGALFGLLNGFLISELHLPSMITTIAVAGLAKALGNMIAQGRTIAVEKDPSAVFYNITNNKVLGIPIVFLVFIALIILLVVIQERTKFGQYVYAIGDSRDAAMAAGIRIKRVQKIVFTLSGLFGAFGGILLMLMVSSGQPTMGSTLFLDSFTKILLGALLLKVGKTNMIGTLVGVLLMAMLVNGLTQMGLASHISQIITGILLIIGVMLTTFIQRRYQRNALQLDV